MPFDHGLRLNNRQRIANARAKPIEANKNQAVYGAEGLFLRSGSPQNVYLLPQHPNFHLKRCPRPKQICDHPNNEPDKISHPARASPDSRSTASQIEFAIGTVGITLFPGDIIVTGTPSGVGAARKPPLHMKPGDVCEIEIEGLGVLRNPIAQEGEDAVRAAA
jgi:Fumarylacetoacetate (FAA) hydrolase family